MEEVLEMLVQRDQYTPKEQHERPALYAYMYVNDVWKMYGKCTGKETNIHQKNDTKDLLYLYICMFMI